MPTNFRHPKRKIALAKENLHVLSRDCKAFFASKPFVNIVEPDDTGFNRVHKVRLTRELPDSILNCVDQVLGALRSALDKACYATSRKTDPRRAYFPIADTSAELDTSVIGKGRCKDLEPEIVNFLRAFKPYKGGNNLLWAINRLCNTDKHKSVEMVLIADSSVLYEEVRWNTPQGTDPRCDAVQWGSYWDGPKRELVLLTVGTGVDISYKIRIDPALVFGKIEGVNGTNAGVVLEAMVNEVERIVDAIEAEAHRLGLMPES